MSRITKDLNFKQNLFSKRTLQNNQSLDPNLKLRFAIKRHAKCPASGTQLTDYIRPYSIYKSKHYNCIQHIFFFFCQICIILKQHRELVQMKVSVCP